MANFRERCVFFELKRFIFGFLVVRLKIFENSRKFLIEDLIKKMMRDYYSELARGYDELYGNEQQEKLRVIKEKVSFSKKQMILDVGCGTGISSALPGLIIGIDPSLGMLQKNTNFKVKGKAESLPFKDSSFDVVLCLTVTHHFSPTKTALIEVDRVGRGIFIFSILEKSKKYGAIKKAVSGLFVIKERFSLLNDVLFVCTKKT